MRATSGSHNGRATNPLSASTGRPDQSRSYAPHFQVAAREMLLDEPVCCPIHGALTFDGLQIDHEERMHLVVRTAAARVVRAFGDAVKFRAVSVPDKYHSTTKDRDSDPFPDPPIVIDTSSVDGD